MATASALRVAPSGLVWVWSMGKRAAVRALAECFETVGGDGAHVDEGDVFRGGDLLGGGTVAHVALDAAIFSRGAPNIADGGVPGGWELRPRASASWIILRRYQPKVCTVSVVPARGAGSLRDVLGFFADSFESAAWLGSAEVAAVVVAHLNEEEVAGFDLGEGWRPRGLR